MPSGNRRRLRRLIISLAIALSVTVPTTPAQAAPLPDPDVLKTDPYYLSLYETKQAPKGTILMMHGGGWRGDRRSLGSLLGIGRLPREDRGSQKHRRHSGGAAVVKPANHRKSNHRHRQFPYSSARGSPPRRARSPLPQRTVAAICPMKVRQSSSQSVREAVCSQFSTD